MFQSATLKLTAWYMAIIIVISLLFSVVIYTVASHEIGTRFDPLPFESQYVTMPSRSQLSLLRHQEIEATRHSLMASLVVSNLIIWLLGGLGSYYTARRMLQPIEEAMEAQARFTSDASHELRTPLASMKTEIEVALRDTELTHDDMRELLTSNLEEVNKLTALSHTLLKMSRLEHGSIAHEPVDLAAALKAVVGRFAAERHRLDLPSRLPHTKVMANQPNLEELLTIFIDNALKYSPPNSQVQIRYFHNDAFSGFELINGGKGIPATLLSHIFDRFYQVDQARTNGTTRGYGLGLSLAKKLVELHGGELTATSQPDGDTIFHVGLRNVVKNISKK